MATELDLGHDKRGAPIYKQQMADAAAGSDAYSVVLAADVDTTLVVPSDVKTAIISYEAGAVCYVGKIAITLPSVGSFVETGLLQNPSAVSVEFGDTLHFRSVTTGRVNVAFYS
jgi:hypothetical protein